ncbi:alpha/beta hydrolase [Corallococcus sp. M34]|uniref:serine aminopeptidase domain-containing protein n=1 Tax=Citreicoccus inhibens TaxID=2849499 RepID=UPI001C234FDA|nr:alpha/beta hydrolase [Citreicoccus inhibens]MBU8895180.1 alpha/beta hydrolase [Citreicoccus inhibens]
MSPNVARSTPEPGQAPAPPPEVHALPLPLVLGPESRRLFGWYHPPQGTSTRRLGVVLCNPLGYEAMPAHRTYRHLAARLAEVGFAVLRFDYDGTGDSAGHDGEPGRVAAWRESVGLAIDALKQRAGVRHVGLFGLRLGGLIALMTAAERDDVRALMLWATPATGRAYVRELRAFRQLKEKENAQAPRPPPSDAGEEIAGYLLQPSTADDLSALRPLEATPRAVRHALLLGRDDLPGAEAQLARHLQGHGVDVSHPSVPGYAAAMRDAEFTLLPEDALDTFVRWMSDTDSREEASEPAAQAAHTVGNAPFECTAPGGARVRERAVRFGTGGRLFGIVSEPLSGRAERTRAGVLFVSVGANHRIGPNRMHVTLSRELASRGFVAMRLDIGGVGDSPPAPGEPEHPLYSKASVRDIQEAMDWLGESYGLRRHVVASVCSGAFLTFHASVADERVAGHILINPQTFVWRAGDSLVIRQREQRPAYETSFKSTRFYRSAALQKETWRRLMRGEIQVKRIAREMLSRAMKQAQTLPLPGPLQSPEQRQHQDVRHAFVALADRGLESLLVYSANDGGLDVIERYLGPHARKLARRPNFRFEVVDGADHTFTPLWAQAHLGQLILSFITRKFG